MLSIRKFSILKPGKWPVAKADRPFFKFLVPVLLLTAILFLPVSKEFTVTDDETGEILFSTSIDTGDAFSIKYVHSVNKSPVEDIFEVRKDNGILLKKTVFKSFGAGVPFDLEEGQLLEIKEDSIEISNINRRISEFLLKVGTQAEHRLCIKGREIRLDSIARPKMTVRFEVRRVSLYFLLRRIGTDG